MKAHIVNIIGEKQEIEAPENLLKEICIALFDAAELSENQGFKNTAAYRYKMANSLREELEKKGCFEEV